MATIGGYNVVTDGLVLSLDAANHKSYVSGSGTWFDVSGNNNSGSLTNGPTFTTEKNGGIVFDGVNDVVLTPTLNQQFLTTGLTLSVIIKYNQTTANDNVICWGSNGAFNSLTSNAWEFRLRGLNYIEFAVGRTIGAEVTPRRLQYVVNLNNRIVAIDITYIANGIATMYENGIPVATQDYTGAGTSTTTRSVEIGKGTDTYFPGTMYAVKLYNRALSAQEILQNYNAQKGRFGL